MNLWWLTRVFFTIYTRGCGCVGRPAFPTPFVGRKINAQLGRFTSRECGSMCAALTLSVVVPASEPGPIITGSGVVRKSSNSVLQTKGRGVWVPAQGRDDVERLRAITHAPPTLRSCNEC